MTVELANGKEVISRHTVGNLDFELGGKPTTAYFRTLPVGVYDRILGMDLLTTNRASIHCAQGTFSFIDNQGQESLVQGHNRRPKAWLCKVKRLLKGYRASD